MSKAQAGANLVVPKRKRARKMVPAHEEATDPEYTSRVSPEPTVIDAEPIGSCLNGDIVSIYIGPTRKQFTIHKNLLCRKIPHFNKLFDGTFAEATTKEAHLQGPTDEPAAYELLSEWLYRGSLPAVSERSFPTISDPRFPDLLAHETAYHNLYYLSEMWFAVDLKNAVMDALTNAHRKSKDSIHVGYLIRGYENTWHKSKLRVYLAESATYDMQARNADLLEKLRVLDASLTTEISLDILDVYKEGCKGFKLTNPRNRHRGHFHDDAPAHTAE